MARFTVIRDRNPAPRSTGAMRIDPIRVIDPRVEAVDLGPADVRDIAEDTSVLGFARSMPTRMITPEPLDDARPEDAVPAWGVSAIGGQRHITHEITLALLDTGIDRGHPVFADIRIRGRDFVGLGIDDANGHGTHLAATVAGRAAEGVPPGVLQGPLKLLVGKVLNDAGGGLSDVFLSGLLWAADEGAMAIGYAVSLDVNATVDLLMAEGQPEALARCAAVSLCHETLALFRLVQRLIAVRHEDRGGVLLIAAAGNDSRRTIAPGFEAGLGGLAATEGVLSVGAVGQSENGLAVAPFSNSRPDIVGPGVGILSAAAGDGMRALNGSSMAMAHVLGATGAWFSQGRSAASVREALLAYADADQLQRFGPYDRGAGLVQMPR